MNGNDLDERQRTAWNKLYSRKVPLWRGPPELDAPFHIAATVLEVGCGNGKTLRGLESASVLVAMDFSAKAISACAEEPDFASVNFVVGDLRELPFASDSFDSVFCVHVLEHVNADERRKAAQELRRVLKVGGKIFIRVFSISDMRSSKGEIIEEGTRMRGDGIPYHYFDQRELASLFEADEILALKDKCAPKRYRGQDCTREEIEMVISKLA